MKYLACPAWRLSSWHHGMPPSHPQACNLFLFTESTYLITLDVDSFSLPVSIIGKYNHSLPSSKDTTQARLKLESPHVEQRFLSRRFIIHVSRYYTRRYNGDIIEWVMDEWVVEEEEEEIR